MSRPCYCTPNELCADCYAAIDAAQYDDWPTGHAADAAADRHDDHDQHARDDANDAALARVERAMGWV